MRFNTAALYALRKAIEGSGVGPQNFVWPPKTDPRRAPYRGWEPFEDIDAGVFFGRDAAIVQGLDELRAMRFDLLARLAGQKSLFVVLGPSGQRQVVVSAGRVDPAAAARGPPLCGAGHHAPAAQRADRRPRVGRGHRHRPPRRCRLGGAPLGEIKTACLHDPDRVVELLVGLRAAAGNGWPTPGRTARRRRWCCRWIRPRNCFPPTPGAQAEQFLTLIAELIGRINATEVGLIVAATIRTDRYELMQNHPALDGIGTVLFNELKPMPPTQFKQVITGPAARASERRSAAEHRPGSGRPAARRCRRGRRHPAAAGADPGPAVRRLRQHRRADPGPL